MNTFAEHCMFLIESVVQGLLLLYVSVYVKDSIQFYALKSKDKINLFSFTLILPFFSQATR